MARYTVLLDACVLVPIALADTLLRLAERELYRPLWSQRILQEVGDAIAEIHPDIDVAQIQQRLNDMDRAFADARVDYWEDFEQAVTLPDANDRTS